MNYPTYLMDTCPHWRVEVGRDIVLATLPIVYCTAEVTQPVLRRLLTLLQMTNRNIHYLYTKCNVQATYVPHTHAVVR